MLQTFPVSLNELIMAQLVWVFTTFLTSFGIWEGLWQSGRAVGSRKRKRMKDLRECKLSQVI